MKNMEQLCFRSLDDATEYTISQLCGRQCVCAQREWLSCAHRTSTRHPRQRPQDTHTDRRKTAHQTIPPRENMYAIIVVVKRADSRQQGCKVASNYCGPSTLHLIRWSGFLTEPPHIYLHGQKRMRELHRRMSTLCRTAATDGVCCLPQSTLNSVGAKLRQNCERVRASHFGRGPQR